jgi:hypothetical protein
MSSETSARSANTSSPDRPTDEYLRGVTKSVGVAPIHLGVLLTEEMMRRLNTILADAMIRCIVAISAFA